jgi:hypothetical protein
MSQQDDVVSGNRAPRCLDDLANLPRWVAWREETRRNADGKEVKRKIPHDPGGGLARIPTDSSTWSTRERAERRWEQLDDGRPGGVGIVLGNLGDGTHLLGVDLDDCIQADGGLEPLADEIIDRFDSYGEVSPSGKGVKLFFLVADDDMAAVKQMFGTSTAGEPKTRVAFAAGTHVEIALDRSRFYCVTEQHLENTPSTFRTVTADDARWFVETAGPRFRAAHATPHDRANPSPGRDESGSAHGFRFMRDRKREGMDYDEARVAILADTGRAGEWANRVDERQLRRAFDRAPEDDEEESRNQADVLIALAEDAELFHTNDQLAFADIEVDGHRETWPLNSLGFRRWLRRRYYGQTKSSPHREALTTAIATLEAKAHFDSPAREVSLRTAGHNGKLYLDLCNDRWEAVEIDAEGWRVVSEPPVRFTRARGMLPLPAPIEVESNEPLNDLQDLINLATKQDFILLLAFILAALRDRGPYPILALRGAEGTGKSTLVRFARALIDPNKVPLRTQPGDERDLYISASNGYVLAYDNVSEVRPWMSDALCRLATGGGFATRQLYTDQDEVLIDATRAIILNGIEDFVARPDLADRCLFLTLEPIADDVRDTEAALNKAFEAKRPAILGVLFDAITHGLRTLPAVRLDAKPRMADFARWAIACGDDFLWDPGEFIAAYNHNRRRAVADVIDADLVADALRTLMRNRRDNVWEGKASALGEELESIVGEKIAKTKAWPSTPRGLRGALQRATSSLRRIGIEISFVPSSTKRTMIRIINRSPR